MAVTALITWLITAVGGFVMLARWIGRGGHRASGLRGPQGEAPRAGLADSGSRLSPPMVFTHFVLAAAGLVVWIIYLAIGSDPLAWVAFVLLLPTALLGFAMFARWLGSRRSTAPESGFPMPVVLGHGAFAATTLVLVLLAALGIGV